MMLYRGTHMNINNVKEQLLKMGQKIGLQVEEETAQSVTLHTELNAKEYFKNSIYFKVVIFSSGTVHMFLTFDEIESTYDKLYLINAFNSENPWFKAYIANINDKDYLELHYSAIALENDNQVIDTFGYLLNELLNEQTLKYLKPILENE